MENSLGRFMFGRGIGIVGTPLAEQQNLKLA